MKNNLLNEMSHMLMQNYIKKDHIAVDMTMGNGFDTIHLAKLAHHVYAFDIQDQAIHSTKEKLDLEKLYNVSLIKDSHTNLTNYIKSFDYVVFNLGYLPKGDKSITTQSDTSLEAVKLSVEHVSYGGFVQITVYTGHLEGQNESLVLEDYMKLLNPLHYKVLKIYLPYQDNKPPYIILIQNLNKKDEN
jgi:tRNA G37 N-methylase Trm5